MTKKHWNNLRRPNLADQKNPSAHVKAFGFAIGILVLVYVIASLVTGDWNLLTHFNQAKAGD